MPTDSLRAPDYQRNGIRLYCGDCLDLLPQMEAGSVDAVVTDPPYDAKTHEGARNGFLGRREIPFAPLADMGFVPELLRVAARWVVCFCSLEMLGDYKRSAGEAWVRAGFWRRTNGVPQFTGDRPGQPGEGVAIMHGATKKRWNGHGRHGFWPYPIEQQSRVHPTQKPLPLMRNLITDFTDDGDTILDPFLGSGTTAIACLETGRKCIGIEKEPRYFDLAVKRCEAWFAEHYDAPLFDPPHTPAQETADDSGRN